METKSIDLLNLLHPEVRQSGLDAYAESVKRTPVGVHPVVLETLRSFKRSAELYAQGRTKPGEIVTTVKAGHSYHNYGLAVDCALLINGRISWVVDKNWLLVAEIWKKHGWLWGGDWKGFKDYPHYEKRLKPTKDLLALYNTNTKDANGYVLVTA